MKYLMIALLLMGINSPNAIVQNLESKASSEGKYIAVYFCGSDWCANCYKFKEQTLSHNEVKTLLNDNFVYYTADFPQRTKLSAEVASANDLIAEKLNDEGVFPVLVIADKNWNVKTKIYKGDLTEVVVDKLNSLKKAN